jgi:hypothetical protein
MAVDDTKLFAWLDGELDAVEAAKVEAEVASDPRLARIAEQHRALGERLRSTFGAIADAPVPERLTEAVKSNRAAIIDFGARRRAATERRSWLPLPQWAAMAATLVLGIGLGTIVGSERDFSPVEVRGGKLVAAAALDDALERQLASAGASGDVRVGLTFRDQSGTVCRSFTNARSSGLACRDGGDWRVRGLFAAPEGQSGDYRMAAGADPNLAALIDSAIQGEPFDAEQEKAARDRGWR